MRIIVDIPLPLSDVVRAVGGSEPHTVDLSVTAVVTDSREAKEGDLFFALASDKEEREMHVRDANLRGAITVGDTCKATLPVPDARRALLSLAILYKSKLPILSHTVGVTGSAGKTTATRFISQLLSESHHVHSTIGNYNNIIGLSISVLCAPRETEILVLEMGMNAEGEIRDLAEAMKPDVCLITNIGTAHIGKLGSREAIARAKCEIVTDACKAVVCPADEVLLLVLPNRFTFAVDWDADFSLYDGRFISPFGSVEVGAVSAIHLRATLCAAMAVATLTVGKLTHFGKDICNANGRSTIHRIRGITVIDDSYNSSPEAVELMLEHLSHLEGPRSLLLSDMLELGEMACELHFHIGERIAAAGVDNLFAIGDYAEQIARGAIYRGYTGGIRIYPRKVNLYEVASDILYAVEGGHLLIKGSHATGLYGIIEILKEIENDGL